MTGEIIPCEQNPQLNKDIEAFAEVLKTQAHTLGDHGLGERDFYASGIFRGAIERIRGQFSADMKEKRGFVRLVLNHMQDRGFIGEWESSEAANRYDYTVALNSGRTAVIELKGCLDGNNTNLFEGDYIPECPRASRRGCARQRRGRACRRRGLPWHRVSSQPCDWRPPTRRA